MQSSFAKWKRRQLKRVFLAGSNGLDLGFSGILGKLFVKDFEITRLDWQSPKIHQPLRIAHLSDLHAANWLNERYYRKIIAACASFQPDLICWTGDFYHHNLASLEHALALFRPMHQSIPSFAVLGNHDFDLAAETTQRVLEASGLRVLRNEFLPFASGENRITLLGIDDWKIGAGRLPKRAFELEADRFRLLLTHQPSYLFVIPADSIDLALAGHLHGGQWRFPLIGAPALPRKLGKFFLQNGPLKIKGNRLYISRGLGYTFVPLRINCPAELVFIEIKPGERADSLSNANG